MPVLRGETPEAGVLNVRGAWRVVLGFLVDTGGGPLPGRRRLRGAGLRHARRVRPQQLGRLPENQLPELQPQTAWNRLSGRRSAEPCRTISWPDAVPTVCEPAKGFMPP